MFGAKCSFVWTIYKMKINSGWGEIAGVWSPFALTSKYTVHLPGLLMYICTFPLRRQNRRDRLLRKRWSHIASDLVMLLENNELNVISLKASQLESGSEFHFTNISAVTLVLQAAIHESTKCKLQFHLFSPLTQSSSRVHGGNSLSVSTLLKCPNWDSFSLQIEDERKNSNFKIRRALYDKKVAEHDTQRLYHLLAALSML